MRLLRSRGAYDGNEILNFYVEDGDLEITSSNAENSVLGSFTLSGTSAIKGDFSYEVSFDNSEKNYITRVLGRTEKDSKTNIFVEEIYDNALEDLINEGKVAGINATLLQYNTSFNNYKSSYTNAITPYIVSEVRGNKLLRLFRFHTISDGNAANKEFKISIQNIKLDEKEFDVVIRRFSDTDAKPVVFRKIH